MSDGPVKRLQITLKSLLLSTSFIGAGIGLPVLAGYAALDNPDRDRSIWWHPILSILQVIAAGPLVGAGVFAPWGRARFGAYLVFFGQIIVVLLIGTSLAGWRAVFLDPKLMPTVALTALVILLVGYGAGRRIQKQRAIRSISENLRLD